MQSYRQYTTAIENDISEDGITRSWFTVYEMLANRVPSSVVVLNSFGVDTRKVVLATLPDETGVMQVTVNWDLWEDRDMQKFKEQFEAKQVIPIRIKQKLKPAAVKESPDLETEVVNIDLSADQSPPAGSQTGYLAYVWSCFTNMCTQPPA